MKHRGWALRRHRWARWILGIWIGASAALVAPAAPVAATAAARSSLDSLPHGQVLRRTLRGDALQDYYLYLPATTTAVRAPVFVTVHGISRNAEEHARLFARHAEAQGVVLVAPLFTESHHGDYQRLGRAGRGPRADHALDAILAEIATLTGATIDRIHLFGYSGGAQFAHRYAMAHPERVAAVVIGAAGWYTWPDAAVEYPYGIAPIPELDGVRFDPQAFLRVPMTVVVGMQDVTDAGLRRNQQVDAQQGRTRLERARNWVAAMRQSAAAQGLPPLATLDTVPEIPHSFREFMLRGELGDRTFTALFGTPALRRR
jgi:poly(3-hydroxybutyrate) depolymerase